MTRLPVVSGRECIKALEQAGFRIVRQKSTHIVLRRDEPYARVTIPDHKTVSPGTLRSIIRDADLTVEEFVSLLL